MNKSIDESPRFFVKPNPLLYALEATRFWLLVSIFVYVVALVFYFRGVPLVLSLEIVTFLYCLSYLVLFVGTPILACGFSFIVTDKTVLLRASFIKSVDEIAIPIDGIERIEIRSYNERYGSVYIDCSRGVDRLPSAFGSSSSPSSQDPLARSGTVCLVERPSGLPIWLSMPFTVPFLRGFYGFKQFDVFSSVIISIQAAEN
jgi:hypothetical protein